MSTPLLDEMRRTMRRRHSSIRTERSYCSWVKRYILFHKMRSRVDLKDGERKIEAFLTHLAMDPHVSPSTPNQAMNALLFLYKHVLRGCSFIPFLLRGQKRERPHASRRSVYLGGTARRA